MLDILYQFHSIKTILRKVNRLQYLCSNIYIYFLIPYSYLQYSNTDYHTKKYFLSYSCIYCNTSTFVDFGYG